MANKRIEVEGRLDQVLKSGVSYYGNPHYWIIVVTKDGEVLYGRTCTNGSIGYGLKNGGVGANAPMKKWVYHTTRSGNIIFDYVKDE